MNYRAISDKYRDLKERSYKLARAMETARELRDANTLVNLLKKFYQIKLEFYRTDFSFVHYLRTTPNHTLELTEKEKRELIQKLEKGLAERADALYNFPEFKEEILSELKPSEDSEE